jgi:hypothetical protein
MRQIYEKANSTLVWLGTEKDGCKKGLELFYSIPRGLPRGDNDGIIDLNHWLESEANISLVKVCPKNAAFAVELDGNNPSRIVGCPSLILRLLHGSLEYG